MKERNQVNFEAKKFDFSFSHFETCDAKKLAIERKVEFLQELLFDVHITRFYGMRF